MIVGIIGSFKQHFKEIVLLKSQLEKYGHTVVNPRGNYLVKENIDFVRTNEDKNEDDWSIQTDVFVELFKSDFVYVFIINGYIGKTTCYEVGRIIQRKIPILFSEQPKDLPLHIPEINILSCDNFLKKMKCDLFEIYPMFSKYNCEYEKKENELIFYHEKI